MDFPLKNELKAAKELIWYNENYTNFDEVKDIYQFHHKDVLEAGNRLTRFAPYIKRVYPQVTDGL